VGFYQDLPPTKYPAILSPWVLLVHVSTFINYLEFEYADNPQQTLNQLRQVKTALLKRGDVGKQTLAALEQAGDEDGNALAQMLARDIYLHQFILI
jgi:lysozyme family protein